VLAAGTTRNGGTGSLAIANFSNTNTSVRVKVALADDQTLAPQTVDVPSRSVVAVDVTARVPLDTDYAVTVTDTSRGATTVPVVAELLASWSPNSSTPAVASTHGSSGAAKRWIVAVPSVDADAYITVLDPGAQPGTAALLPAESLDRRAGVSSEPERAIKAGGLGTFHVARVNGDSGALVVTANHPVVVGLTMLGGAGASTTAAVPDPAYAG
jgi:hypothetical protein